MGLPIKSMFMKQGASGGSPNLSYLQLQTYTGDGLAPRSFASTEDISDGFIWTKRRTVANQNARRFVKDGVTWYMVQENASARSLSGNFSADTNSWDIISDVGLSTNVNGSDYYAWLFKKTAGAVDWVHFTGNGTTQSIAHSLGVVPGAMLIKNLINGTGTNGAWYLYHRQFNGGVNPEQYGKTFASGALSLSAQYWNNTAPDSANFTVGNGVMVNGSTNRVLVMLFAHDTSSTGTVQCVSYTGNGNTSGPTVTLGWQPRMVWIMRLASGSSAFGLDIARTPGFTGNDAASDLVDNLQDVTSSDIISMTVDGFQVVSSSATYNNLGSPYGVIAFR